MQSRFTNTIFSIGTASMLCAAVHAGGASITNITQDQSYGSIQAAINASVPGDVIELGAGMILDWGFVLSDKDITIRGQGRDLTIINAGHNGRVFKHEAGDSSTVEDLSITNGLAVEDNGGGAVQVFSDCSTTYRNVDFKWCDGNNFPHGAFDSAGTNSFVSFESCRFIENFGASESSAFGATLSSGQMINCLFAGNHDAFYTVRPLFAGFGITNCTFANNTDGHGAGGSVLTVENSVFDASNPVGAVSTGEVIRSLLPGGRGSNINGVPTFVDAANGDYRLASTSLGIDAAFYDVYITAGGGAFDLNGDPRTFDDCIADTGVGEITYLDMGAYETEGTPPPPITITNVTTATSYCSIADAIAGAVAGDVIELGEGTIQETGMLLSNKHITIRGQGRSLTIIDGDYQGRVIRHQNNDTSTVENLTIQHGKAVTANGGGCVQVAHGCTTTYRNVDFKSCDGNNFSYGAFDCSGNNSYMLFESCRFLDNFGATVGSAFGSVSSGGRMINCLFAGNSGANRTINPQSGALEIINCTFANNTDNLGVSGTAATVINTVFDGAHLDGAVSGVTPARSLFPGATGSNINGVPTFVDAANGDYRLASGSLGIDAGDYDAYVAANGGAFDLSGEARTHDDESTIDTGTGSLTYLDLGAFEFQGLCPADIVNSNTFLPPGDGIVDGADLAYLLGEWGNNPGSLADMVDSATFLPPPDGVVDGADLATLLGAWGSCE